MDDPAAAKDALKTAWVNSLRGGLVDNPLGNGGSIVAAAAASGVELPPPQLGVQLPTSLEDLRLRFQQQHTAAGGPATAAPKWYKTPAFIQTAIVVGVFLLVFILLVCIQPPFLNTRPSEDEYVDPKFSPGNAAWFAFGASALCGIIFGILAIVKSQKAKKAAAAPAAATSL